jgi:hypothetical protein
MRAETAVFASHPPPALLRTAPVASKPASIKAFQASYQLASPLGKRKSGFISYSHRDEEIKNELIKHLMPLKRLNLIADWHDRKIEAGDKWEEVISENLKKADIVILLISIDFINSKYCYDNEMETALDRAEKGLAVIIPVIARSCMWKNSRFSPYQALPTDGKAITTWGVHAQDEALTVVAEGIRRVADQLMSKR